MVSSFSACSGRRVPAVLGLFFCAFLMAPAQESGASRPSGEADASAALAPPPSSMPGGAAAATPEKAPATSSNYVLQNNDLVRITVFQEDDLTTETRVSKNGSITFPLLGSLQLAGKTVGQVTLSVMEYSKLHVTVLGEVQHPGYVEIPTEGGLDLLGAIALASGYTPDADSSHVNIRRIVNGKESIIYIDAMELARDPNAKPFIIQAGDAITVPYIKKWVTVLGEVQHPGKVVLPSEGQLDLLGAIALAGGYTVDAEPEKVDVRRSVNGHDTVLTINATDLARNTNVQPFIVEPGDSIIVHYNQDWVTILGEVQHPGKVKIPPEGGLDLLGAIALASGFGPNADQAHVSVRRTVGGKDVIMSVNAKKLSHDTAVSPFMVLPGDNITVPQRMF